MAEDVAEDKFFKGYLWIFKCLRVVKTSHLGLLLIIYILEETWSRYSDRFIEFHRYRIDRDCFYDNDSKKTKRAYEFLREKNMIVIDGNKIAINFNTDSWNVSQVDKRKMNDIKMENKIKKNP